MYHTDSQMPRFKASHRVKAPTVVALTLVVCVVQGDRRSGRVIRWRGAATHERKDAAARSYGPVLR